MLLPGGQYQQFLKELESRDGEITSAMLSDLIQSNAKAQREAIRKYDAYMAKGLPIESREYKDKDKSNNKINCDFRGLIVDSNVGYLFGNPPKYTLDPIKYAAEKTEKADKEGNKKKARIILSPDEEKKYAEESAFFSDFLNKNFVVDLDMESGKSAAITGRAARLCYIGTEKTKNNIPDYRLVNLPASNCIFIYDNTLRELQYAMYYYPITEYVVGNSSAPAKTITKVEWYDKQNVYYFTSGQDNSNFQFNESNPHGFDYVPLFEIENNAERMGDFDKVEKLIDGYDGLTSDNINEIQDFADAILILQGARMSEEDIAKLKRTRVWNLANEDKPSYLTKMVDTAAITSNFDRVSKNIFKFSKVVDTQDPTFTGAGGSGIARKWAVKSQEENGSIKERKFVKALQYQFKVLASAWNKLGISIDNNKISVQFDRNLPVDYIEEANFLAATAGQISKRTRYELSALVDNVDEELARIEEEKNADAIDLDLEGADAKDGEGQEGPEGKIAENKEGIVSESKKAV